MTNYLVANSNSKITTYIHKKCFENIISLLPNSIKDIKINYSNNIITFFPKGNNVELSIEIKISQKVKSIEDKVNQIKNKIEVGSLALLGIKPKNIIIFILGTY